MLQSVHLKQDCKQHSTASSTSANATTKNQSMIIYHKIDNYYGVLDGGITFFHGSYDACVEYVKLMTL